MSFEPKVSKLISVIIPCFNNDKYIIETLASVHKQSYKHWECIIVDDGSTDSSCQIVSDFIKSDNRFSFFKRPDSYLKGANSCRNFGAKKSKGEYLIFLDSDDLLLPNTLNDRIGSINSNQNIEVAIFKTNKFKNVIGDTFENVLSTQIELEEVINSFFNYRILWNIHSVLWKASFFNRIGKFDERLSRFQDYDLHLKMLIALRSDEILFFPYKQVDSYYRFSNYHATMTKEKKTLILRDAKYIMEKFKRENNRDFGIGYIKYLFYQYNSVFTKNDYKFFKHYLAGNPHKSSLIINVKISGFFRFNNLLNKMVSKLLLSVI